MFRSLAPPGATVAITLEGETLTVGADLTLAAALLAAGRPVCRHTPATGSPRAPFCAMGVCFDCLVEIDGNPAAVQACLAPVRDGMSVRRLRQPAPVPAEFEP